MSTKIFRTALVVATSILFSSCTPAPESTSTIHTQLVTSAERSALEVVALRTAAYNGHDIEAFLATYDENVRIYEFPDRFLGEGKERMRSIFGPQFAENDGSIAVHSQHALENVVISDETVTIYDHPEHNIGVYTIRDGLIIEVRLIEPSE